jgi:hypothetical protein
VWMAAADSVSTIHGIFHSEEQPNSPSARDTTSNCLGRTSRRPSSSIQSGETQLRPSRGPLRHYPSGKMPVHGRVTRAGRGPRSKIGTSRNRYLVESHGREAMRGTFRRVSMPAGHGRAGAIAAGHLNMGR